jgi:hypothetical protein
MTTPPRKPKTASNVEMPPFVVDRGLFFSLERIRRAASLR